MKLQTKIQQIFYKKPTKTGFWMIIKTDSGTAKGEIAWIPQSGERIILSGDWTEYQGSMQFSFTTAMPDIPSDSRSILKYVCELACGLGDKMEETIWNECGDKWQEISQGQVKGLTERKYKAFKDAKESVYQNANQLKAITWMVSKGISYKCAGKAYTEWGIDCMGKISNNVYCLGDLENFGFHTADVIRDNFGIEAGSNKRIRAAIAYCLKKLTSSGDTVIQWSSLKTEVRGIIGPVYDCNVCNMVALMIREEEIIAWRDTKNMALAEVAKAEMLIWEYIGGLK